MAGRKESGSVTRGFPVLFIITFHRTEKTWQIWMYKESGCGNVKSFRHSRLSWRFIWLEDTRKYLGISWRQKTIQPAFGWGNATHPPDIRIWGRAPSLPGQGQDRPTALKIGTQYIGVNNSGTRRYRRFWPPPSGEDPANLLTVAGERGAVFIGFYKRFHKRSLVVWFFHSYVFPICVVFLFIRFPLSYAPQLSTYFPLSRSLYGNILTGIETWSNV